MFNKAGSGEVAGEVPFTHLTALVRQIRGALQFGPLCAVCFLLKRYTSVWTVGAKAYVVDCSFNRLCLQNIEGEGRLDLLMGFVQEGIYPLSKNQVCVFERWLNLE